MAGAPLPKNFLIDELRKQNETLARALRAMAGHIRRAEGDLLAEQAVTEQLRADKVTMGETIRKHAETIKGWEQIRKTKSANPTGTQLGSCDPNDESLRCKLSSVLALSDEADDESILQAVWNLLSEQMKAARPFPIPKEKLRPDAVAAPFIDDPTLGQLFVKKRIAIRAFRYELDPWPKWFDAAVQNCDAVTLHGQCDIKTLEGEMTAKRGDWIVSDIKGEIYPVRADIFAETYDVAKPLK